MQELYLQVNTVSLVVMVKSVIQKIWSLPNKIIITVLLFLKTINRKDHIALVLFMKCF